MKEFELKKQEIVKMKKSPLQMFLMRRRNEEISIKIEKEIL
jgi:hypothetical protein